MNKIQILCYFLLFLAIRNTNIISTIQIDNGLVDTGVTITNNFVGVSSNFSQVYSSIINLTLFQQYLGNAKVWGATRNSFFNSIKVQSPKGYKYNCSVFTKMNVTATCIYDLAASITKLGTFFKNSGFNIQSAFGHDMQGSNFSNSNYIASLTNLLNNLYSAVAAYNTFELVDLADQYESLSIKSNYTPTNFLNDMYTVQTLFPYLYMSGPGITQSASTEWMDTYTNYTSYFSGPFTVRCIPFKTTAELTIQNVLNESYYRSYLINRFSGSSGPFNIGSSPMGITDIKMSPQIGVNGVTNAFVSAIWAIDTALQFATLGGVNINFNIDFIANGYQNLFGPSPTFKPSAMYYGLMILKMVQYNFPRVYFPNVLSGTSQFIKSYAFIQGLWLSILILNKDTNPNLTGQIKIKAKHNQDIQCLYLTAPSLSQTNNITLAGYYFIANNATPQGNYSSVFYPNVNGSYYVNISYAQVALCYLSNPKLKFVVATAFGQKIQYLLLLFMIFLIS